MSKIKVLVVDDSALMRQLICEILKNDRNIEVIGTARDPYVAREKILAFNPDVLTLDVEMPRMDGLTFLEKLMIGHPMPVVMLSSLTEKGCDVSLRALELGAVEIVTKPKVDLSHTLIEKAHEIIDKIKAAAAATVRRLDPERVGESSPGQALAKCGFQTTHQIIAIGASTGGTEAIAKIFSMLPPDSPGIVTVIHMPPEFTSRFASRLDSRCAISVKEATDGDTVTPGHAYIAPGNRHMRIERCGAKWRTRIFDGDKVSSHRPSVDVLFESFADSVGSNGVGVILTGMGHDGAAGMAKLHRTGAYTIAQDSKSCVVFGMPRVAIELGGVDDVVPLDQIPEKLMSHFKKRDRELSRAKPNLKATV